MVCAALNLLVIFALTALTSAISAPSDPSVTANAHTLALTQAEKDLWLWQHNRVRNETGDSTVLPLVWSEAVAASAALKTSNCEFAHLYGQDNPNGFGENIYLGYLYENGEEVANRSSQMWADEIQNIDAPAWTCIGTPDNSVTCGHYSQMVWKQTLEVGCAATQGCYLWGNTWTVVFCEYNPAGNLVTWNPKTIYPPF